MSLKRRLQNLECRPFRRPVAKPIGGQQWILPTDECKKMRSLQQMLCLPLPDKTTPTERAHALALMTESQRELRIDLTNTKTFDELRDYASGLHAKYGTVPFWGEQC